MKTKTLSIVCAAALPVATIAAVPIRWTVETSRLSPATFEVVRGETLALEAEFNSYGKPLELSGDARLCWQTNGMGSAWWTAAATVAETNRIRATWLPAYDTGATVVYAFIGQTGSNYRAAFTLRYRPGPGATPNDLPLPTPTIDCATVTFLHPEAAPFGGGGAGCDTNAVSGIITNHVESGYICTVAAAQSYTDTSCAQTLASAKTYTDNAINAADIVRYDVSGEPGQKLKHGGTSVTASDVGALPTTWKDDEDEMMAGGASYLKHIGASNEYMLEYSGEITHPWQGWRENDHGVFEAVLLAFVDDIPTAEIAALATTQATHTATLATQSSQLTQLSQSIDYSTNNAALVSTITNLAPTKARGISLADPVRHCNWYQAVTNGVFFWNVEE